MVGLLFAAWRANRQTADVPIPRPPGLIAAFVTVMSILALVMFFRATSSSAGFYRRPIMLEGILCGAVGGSIAALVGWFVGASRKFPYHLGPLPLLDYRRSRKQLLEALPRRQYAAAPPERY